MSLKREIEEVLKLRFASNPETAKSLVCERYDVIAEVVATHLKGLDGYTRMEILDLEDYVSDRVHEAVRAESEANWRD